MPQQQALQGEVFSRPLAVVLVVAVLWPWSGRKGSEGGAAATAAGDAAVKAAAVVVTATARPGLVPGRWYSVGKGEQSVSAFVFFFAHASI